MVLGFLNFLNSSLLGDSLGVIGKLIWKPAVTQPRNCGTRPGFQSQEISMNQDGRKDLE